MATNIDKLRERIERLERELAKLRPELERLSLSSSKPLTISEWQSARMARIRAANVPLRPLIDKVFEEMGIVGKPIGAEKVQELIAACGVMPEENLFSRGILQMRESRE